MVHSLKIILFILSLAMCTISCESPSTSTTETLTIFTTSIVDGKAAKDSLLYKEMITYKGDIKQSITYYNLDQIKGVESFILGKDGISTGAEYTSDKDTLMSYYKYVNDNKGRKVSSSAFDAVTHELLRIETFEYDEKNFLISRSTLASDNTLQRKYIFRNDATGNPLELNILNASGDTIVNETFTYTKFDDKKRWVEKWGFVAENPKTCYIRAFDSL